MIISCVRKHRLTKFVWFGLGCLEFCILIVAIGQLTMNQLQSKNCNFGLEVIYGVDIGILFALSMLIGYKTHMICLEINEFALHGNLPSQRSIKCKSIVIITIWSLTLTYLILEILSETILRFDTKHENFKAIKTFDLVNKWIEVLLFIIVSVFYFLSARLLVILQKNLHSKERPLVSSTRFV